MLREVGSLVVFGLVAVLAIVGFASGYWLGHDNAIEEIAEDVIEKQIGVDVDLSPGSPEKKR